MKAIPGVSWVIEHTPHMDYEGQRLSERIYQCIVILFSVVGLIWGYICQQFNQTIYIIGAGFVLAVILVLIPWPFYRRHPLHWQKLDMPISNKPKGSGNKGGGKGKKTKS